MRRALSVILALTLLGPASPWARRALAAPMRRVLVIAGSSTPTPTELILALRIQLGQSAEVLSVAAPDDGSGEAEAARRERAAGAAIVLWIDDASHVYALTGSSADTPVELGVHWPVSAEGDRVLALKVGELLERAQSGEREVRPARARTRAFVEAGLRVWQGGSPAQLVPGSAISIGPRWEWPNGVLEAHGSFAFDRELDVRAPVGQVEVDTTFVGFGGRGLWRAQPFVLGLFFELGVDVLRARGTTADKRLGKGELRVPTAALGCDLRLHLMPSFELRASAGPRFLFVHERLALEGKAVFDLGTVHPAGSLAAVVIFP